MRARQALAHICKAERGSELTPGYGAGAKGAPPAGAPPAAGGGGGGGALAAAALIALPVGAYFGYLHVTGAVPPVSLPRFPGGLQWPFSGAPAGAGKPAAGGGGDSGGGGSSLGGGVGAAAGGAVGVAPLEPLPREEAPLQPASACGGVGAGAGGVGAGAPAGAEAAGAEAAAAALAALAAVEEAEAAAAAARVAAAMDAAAAAEALPAVAAAAGAAAGAAAAAPPPHAARDAGYEDSIDELAAVRGTLQALGDEVTPSGLLAAADAAGYGARGDLLASAAQLRQATADALLLGHAVQGLVERQQQLEAQLAAERAARAAAERDAEQKADALVSGFKSLIEEQRAAADAARAAAVRGAEERAAAGAARQQLVERLERSQSLDAVRGKVNALSEALSRRSREARAGTEAHRAALGAMALVRALEEGRPLAGELQALAAGCPDDPIVAAVAASLPAAAAAAGLPTQAELEQRFEGVARAALRLAYFRPESGGILAHAAAAAAAALKTDAGSRGGGGGGADEGVSEARAHLRAGQLLAAADALARAAAGSEAAAAVEGWVADARARALADQNARLLQAHATSAAAALA
ncbi:MAG: mitochondrial inner membrane protein-domain-containing protein [Monoraphidium minutum]|nr:MAG: mitochondrial inner membrane protein-domain-containing protein [Monoraphidium minutum]